MMMKRLILISGFLSLLLPRLAPAEDWHRTYDGLLQKYVTADGVKYKDWHATPEDRLALNRVIEGIAGADLGGREKSGQLAFYLNAYNAWILHRILEEYPSAGPGGGGFFGRNRFFKAKNLRVAGETTSFHVLENGLIRPLFKEPRIHFALNCASTSCPPLHARAFVGEHLDETLDVLANTFINRNAQAVRINGNAVEVSKIFDWYSDDFEPDVRTYLNRYRTEKLPDAIQITFQKYRWTLNEAR